MPSNPNPSITKLPISQRPCQPPATLVGWPTGNPSAVTGPGVPARVPGETTARPAVPNVASKPTK